MTAYYNEFNPEAAAWLRELIKEKLIAPGEVDERSIIDVEAKELAGYRQHHFFAGIGGWSYALRLAGWPDDHPVWTASLPCQPFSAAGKGLGKADERHLLPHFLDLVKQCKPDVIFGEQVERAIAHGWLDDLQTTMEAENYAVGHCILGAHSIGSAHIRQRLYWVADYCGERCKEQQGERRFSQEANGNEPRKDAPRSGWMGNSQGDDQQRDRQREACDGSQESIGGSGISRWLCYTESQRRAVCDPQDIRPPDGKGYSSANANNSIDEQSPILQTSGIDWIYCRDGKYRPIESGILPLAHGVPRGMVHSSNPNASQEARKMRLHGYGNAIVPQVAAEFIGAFTYVTQNL